MKKVMTILAACFMLMNNLIEGECDRQENYSENAEKIEFLPFQCSYSEQEENGMAIVSLGSLDIYIPDGWQMETRQEEVMTQHVLVDVHTQHEGCYEHEIVITPYTISHMPENTLQLAGAMKEYFPVPVLYGLKGTGKTEEIEGCWMYGENHETEEQEYFLFLRENSSRKSPRGEGNEMELFHVRERGTYDYENLVRNFQDFMRYIYTTDNSAGEEYYYWFNRQSAAPLFVVMQSLGRDREGEVKVYQQGNYDTPIACVQVQNLTPGWIEIMDINGDGNEDFIRDYQLADPPYSAAYAIEEDFDGYLWDEEQNTFIYTPGKVMLEEYSYLWDESINLDSPKEEELIPEGLIEYLKAPLLESKEKIQDVMLPMESDYELTLEEVQELAGDNEDIANEIREIEIYSGSGTWLWVDVDNDGIKDIYLSEYLGGSLGSIYYYLFAGREDGSYELTDKMEELRQEFSFIKWKGKNYLAKITWGLAKKVNNGISLECYEDGAYQGGVWLAITPKEGGREIGTSYLKEEKYRSVEENLLEFAKQYQIGEEMGPGTAEAEDADVEYNRSSDLDNDGKEERYTLRIWKSTTYHSVDGIVFNVEDEEIDARIKEISDREEIPGLLLNMWVDKTECGNMIFFLYEEGLYDFHICGWLLSEDTEEKVVQVDCLSQVEVTKNIIDVNLGCIRH
ncbi:MAG: hypothetical protein NC429_12505 [Lachnospiraceae bacterium]|nr:hypothetical protein [Lachnospiraceae bacterium]